MGKVDRFLRGYMNLCVDHGIHLQGRGAEDWGGEWMDVVRMKDNKKLTTIDNEYVTKNMRYCDDDDW